MKGLGTFTGLQSIYMRILLWQILMFYPALNRTD